MNVNDVLNLNVEDLKMAYEIAKEEGNDTLKKYILNRLELIEKNKEIYQYISINTLVDSYVIDLELFLNVSTIIKDIESKDYFKNRIVNMINKFKYLINRRDVISLL